MTASHLVALDGGWSLWRWASLRATGFPADLVLALRDRELATAADRWAEHDAAAAQHHAAMVAACEAALARGIYEQAPVHRALTRLAQQRVPEPVPDAAAEAARQQLAAATALRDAAASDATACYARATRAGSEALRRIAADDRFTEAVLWQNPAAVRASLAALLRQPEHATDSKTRQRERLVAMYLQRYCVKNDTIGFFGPFGWARFVDEPTAILQRPGPSLVATSTVYYEYWAIDALADKLAADPEIRAHAAPRLLPRFRIEGTMLHHPIGQRTELGEDLAAVAARCDGVRSARELARELLAEPALGLADEAAVFALIDELVDAGAATWTLEIPTAGAHPERHLANLLARIDAPEPRQRGEAALAELEQVRARVAASRGAAELEASFGELGAVFRAATDVSGEREHGKTYAARTPLYLDCRRDLDAEVGRAVLDRLAPPLALVLQSARWYTHEIARRYRQQLGAIYRALRDSERTPRLDFARFWQDARALFPGGHAPGSIVGDVRAELQRRWGEVLAFAPTERVVTRSARAIADAVARTFAAPCPGWPAARHHSPDVLVAGDQLVLGEVHTGMNTVCGPVFVKEHPEPDALIAARDVDLDHVSIAPVWTKAITRADYYSLSPRDVDLEVGTTRSARPRSQVVTTGELIVEDRDGRLEVSTLDGRRRFDIIEFCEHYLIAESFAGFSPIARGERSPRVVIDDLVLARASWRIATADLPWTKLADPGPRFLGARRWVRALGLPAQVFVRTPEEIKPVYIDFDSTLYVELLAKLLRDSSEASISEMLPTVEQAWVVDRDGARYSGELRIAAVDPERWRPE